MKPRPGHDGFVLLQTIAHGSGGGQRRERDAGDGHCTRSCTAGMKSMPWIACCVALAPKMRTGTVKGQVQQRTAATPLRQAPSVSAAPMEPSKLERDTADQHGR